MAQVVPFRGYRYSADKIPEIGDVVTQPYDKISPEMYREYLERHPQNMVHIIKNRDHQNAGSNLRQWMQDGVLKQDDSPSFYPYEQRFEFEGQTLSRMGLIGLVSLKAGSASVKGHERVLDEQLEDRLNLMRSTESNEGLIFMLYSDPSRGVQQLLSEFKQNNMPVTELVDNYQVSHRLWQLSEQGPQQQIMKTLNGLPFYIADGHHRFRSAQLYFQECQEKGWKAAAEESFDKRMIALFDMEGPGVRVLPTHRGIRNLKDFDFGTFLSRLEPHFELQKSGRPPPAQAGAGESRNPDGIGCPKGSDLLWAMSSGRYRGVTQLSCRPSQDPLGSLMSMCCMKGFSAPFLALALESWRRKPMSTTFERVIYSLPGWRKGTINSLSSSIPPA